jgi:23S rRNA (uracil1939-C5)-methyltransferase
LLLTIEKMIYGGDGLARLPADDAPAKNELTKKRSPDSRVIPDRARGKAVFAPFVLTGEKIEASIIEEKSGFVRARADAILEPSPHRVKPSCSYFEQCGGCHYQHIAYEQQLEIKKEILRETLKRTAKIDLLSEIEVHASSPWNYRNRSRLQVQTTPTFRAGYFKLASRDLLAVEECPISSPLINRGIAALWQSGRAGNVPQGINEVEFFANADDTQLLVELSCRAEARRSEVRAWSEEFLDSLPEMAGVVAFRQTKAAMMSKETEPEKFVSLGTDHLIYQTQRAAYRVSAGSFFQTNRFLTDELVKIVTQGQSGKVAFDLYAGVGLFSTALACDFDHVVSVESSQTSSADLAYNLPPNGKVAQATAGRYLARSPEGAWGGKGTVLPQVAGEPDLAVVDPPRSGLGDPVARQLANSGAPRVTYVSCDPATLARDLVHLLAAGYRLEQVHLVDLFPQTYHLETVVQLVK